MKRTPKLEVFEDKAGEWRWRLKAGNGRIVSPSGESFDSERNARRAAERVLELMREVQGVTVAAGR